MNKHRKSVDDIGETGPGTDLDATEGADIFETKTEAKERNEEQRDDLIDEDIISLDGSD